MKKTMIFLAAMAAATDALAHSSLAVHDHPHGASALMGLDVIAGIAAFAAFTLAVALVLRRGAARVRGRK